MIVLEINNLTAVKINKTQLKKTAQKIIGAVSKEKIEFKKFKKIEISLAFVGDSRIKKLNKIWRGKNRITDVLSFGVEEIEFKNSPVGDVFISPDNVKRIGEIVIDPHQAKKQAKKFGHSLDKEIIRLLAHGILHLLGYDHENDKEALEMERLEEKILMDF
ncbi:MAG: rRNA maturation RNase YbeY [Parcubacteria group bacterium]|nr:rRNA maturation RNase YbeY [Parcubacteria group bacterium]